MSALLKKCSWTTSKQLEGVSNEHMRAVSEQINCNPCDNMNLDTGTYFWSLSIVFFVRKHLLSSPKFVSVAIFVRVIANVVCYLTFT